MDTSHYPQFKLPDLDILKLQYEILNVSIESMASQAQINKGVLESIIENQKWKRKWVDPEEPELTLDKDDFEEDELTVQSEKFVERAKKRLAAYIIAKNILLAQRYLELEASIVNKAILLTNQIDETGSTKAVKDLSVLFNNMLKGAPLNNILELQALKDIGGLPTLVVRDLAG